MKYRSSVLVSQIGHVNIHLSVQLLPKESKERRPGLGAGFSSSRVCWRQMLVTIEHNNLGLLIIQEQKEGERYSNKSRWLIPNFVNKIKLFILKSDCELEICEGNSRSDQVTLGGKPFLTQLDYCVLIRLPYFTHILLPGLSSHVTLQKFVGSFA